LSLVTAETPASTLLAMAGAALHGPDWAAPLARDLGLNDRTIRRIKAAALAGKTYPIAPGALDQAAGALRLKGRQLVELAEQISAAARAIEDRPRPGPPYQRP
jgi:hypothetical protein